MDFANQYFFDRPDALPVARGMDQSSYLYQADGTVHWIRNGGIVHPVRHEIPTGSRLIRFGKILPHFALQGGWWLEWAAYKQVETFAVQNKISVQLACRLLCCVPPEWSQMTVVLQVRTIAPLLAYRGNPALVEIVDRNERVGKIIVPESLRKPVVNKMAIVRDANNNLVPQLYIPGTASADMRRDAMLVEGTGQLPTEVEFRWS